MNTANKQWREIKRNLEYTYQNSLSRTPKATYLLIPRTILELKKAAQYPT
jgi:hypothetical protein